MMADAFVLDRLSSIKATYDELGAKLEDPEVTADVTELLRITKDRAKLEETVTAFETYQSLTVQLEEAKEMFAETDDADMKDMVRDEQRELEEQLEELDERLKLLLLPSDPNDDKNVRPCIIPPEQQSMGMEHAVSFGASFAICASDDCLCAPPASHLRPLPKQVMFEIRAGTGGDEAAIWAADLLKLYSKYADSQGWQTRVVSRSDSEAGGCREATLEVKGDAVYSKLKFEAGVHRVQRVPATETQGRVHTSTATGEGGPPWLHLPICDIEN
jgi:peptide chain release factor 1